MSILVTGPAGAIASGMILAGVASGEPMDGRTRQSAGRRPLGETL